MITVGSARRALRRAVELASGLVARGQVEVVGRRAGAGPVVVLDIDNTLADSWPTFLQTHRSQRQRLASIEPLPAIKAVAHDAPLAAGATVCFLSHRNLWEWPVTRRWLRTHGYAARWWNVVLVPSAASKVAHVARLARGHDVTVWDDLSHGHETGEVVFYADVIAQLADLGVDHRGWDEIVALTRPGRDANGGRV